MRQTLNRTAARARARLLARLVLIDGSMAGFMLGLAVGQVGMLGMHSPTFSPILRLALGVSALACLTAAVALVRHCRVTWRAWADTFEDVALMDRWDRHVTRTLGV